MSELLLEVADDWTVAPPATSRRREVAITLALGVPIALVLAVALLGPSLAPTGVGQTVGLPYTEPGERLLGTDHLGRDVLSRLLHGGRSIVVLPLVATFLATLIGGSVGIAAATGRRRAGRGALRILDVVLILPPTLVLLLLLHRFGAGDGALITAVLLISVPFVARFAKAAAEPLVRSGFVEQAVASGEGSWSVMVRELAPNLVGPLLADAGLRFVSAVHLVAAAGFLGFGPSPPSADWGSMISENISGASLNPWGVVAPALAIAVLTVPVNLLADRAVARSLR